MAKHIGILTAGGDSPGLNAAIRGVGKASTGYYGMNVIGFRDGFRGLMENRTVRLDSSVLSGILTIGGTILGTSRDKPHRMPVGDKTLDMTDVLVANYHKHNLDALVCLGGGGTAKNAYRLMQHGLNVITLPKTIDNDVACTDTTFGFDTALTIATEAIDRLHSTAHSHHRIIVLEVMGHNAGWLALAAGIAGGADVVLIPEIPYDVNKVADAIMQRSRGGKGFSIVCVSEGAMPKEEAESLRAAQEAKAAAKKSKNGKKAEAAAETIAELESEQASSTVRLTRQLEQLTRLESRVTILGHVQRGGTPSAADRLLATRLGTACADLIDQGVFGVMIAARGDGFEPVPLEQVAGHRKTVPLDHPWIESARHLGMNMGD
ncbi:MAG TPA: ATP-dependent 6-phosphofructokinase [Aggregatilinea sp.]|uniref:6-phosphofructokinase n=1 Tax=Aggregatilinea sp. TaxID=2806333 RepID=UPI002C08891A|nr:ATP-dependent 6-phosphofructokinase [Aggregatilinea sp.]HML23673.1 ATP-dependent 6-phosphofructokinase [Aggregatilinea sp.]